MRMNRKTTLSLTLAAIIVALAVIGGVVLTISLVSIAVPPTEEQVSIQEEEMEIIGMWDVGFIDMYKTHDNKDNVTCWIYRGGQGGGISCIPDHMLTP